MQSCTLGKLDWDGTMRLVYAKDDVVLRLKRDMMDVVTAGGWEHSVELVWVPVENSLNLWFDYRGQVRDRNWIGNVK